MLKICSIVLCAGAVGVVTCGPVQACGGGGGGGGGCGMSGGRMAGGGYRGGIRPASSKALSSYVRNGAPATRTRAPAALPGAPNARVAARRAPVTRPTVSRAANVKPASAVSKPAVYTCPMHPQVQWTKPVDCPICGMKLKLKAAHGPSKPPPDAAASNAAQADDVPMADMPGMDMRSMSDGADMEGMGGMDDMMMCPGCMGGMSGMGGSKSSRKASRKVLPGRGAAGTGCGC